MEIEKISSHKSNTNEFKFQKNLLTKNQNAAHLGALLNQHKSYATLRLMKDYNEIHKQPFPLIGVSAEPIDDTMFIWHANVRALCDNELKGSILHIDIRFSDFYPKIPPKLKVMNSGFTHPCILNDGSICLDMLERSNGEAYNGWNPGYTVLSILLQLQSLFDEFDKSAYDEKKLKKLPKAIRSMNTFKCRSCSHNGSTEPYPKFLSLEESSKVDYTLPLEKYNDLIKDEFKCVIRKSSFSEGPLGYGLTIDRIPRTGEIKGINIINEYLSLKSFQKQRIRNIGVTNKCFTHWIPLYFGKEDNMHQFKTLSEKAISMISTGSTKNFQQDMIVRIYTKILGFLAMEILVENSSISNRHVKTFVHIYRSFRAMLDYYPEAQQKLEEQINKYINEPNHRIKENTPNLKDLLTCVLMSEQKNIFEKIKLPYIEEAMDRNIFWSLQALPELEELINSSSIDDIRAKVCFNAKITSNRIFLLYSQLYDLLFLKNSLGTKEFNEKLDSNYGTLSEKETFLFQKTLKTILKIDTYDKYFELLKLPVPNQDELNTKLKKAFQNSLSKGYHGSIDEHRYVPNENEQIKILLERTPNIGDFISEGKLIDEKNEKWKTKCLEFDFIIKEQAKNAGIEMNSLEVLFCNMENQLEKAYHSKPIEFNKTSSIESTLVKSTMPNLGEDLEKEYLEKLSWKDTFIKLFFEFYLENFRYIGNFKELYEYLDLFKESLTHLTILISNDKGLKSDYNYLRVVISKLTNVKFLKIYFLEGYNIKILKNINKGYSNFLIEGGTTNCLKVFCDKSCSTYNTQEFNLLSFIDKMSDLLYLDISNTSLHNLSILKIRNHLYYHKTLKILNLSNSSLNDDMSKELADGIMKAKNLEYIDLSRNNTKTGIATLIYNMSFQPLL